jgi:hypothetical protein
MEGLDHGLGYTFKMIYFQMALRGSLPRVFRVEFLLNSWTKPSDKSTTSTSIQGQDTVDYNGMRCDMRLSALRTRSSVILFFLILSSVHPQSLDDMLGAMLEEGMRAYMSEDFQIARRCLLAVTRADSSHSTGKNRRRPNDRL